MRSLILWDIDGTLLRGGKIAGAVFAEAVEAVLGIPAAGHGVAYGGKTDPQILREIMTAIGRESTGSDVATALEHLERLIDAAREEMRTNGWVLPGVPTLLEQLQLANAVQTVLTGNTQKNALCKLDVFGLAPWVDVEVGAFGSDSADRNALVPLALSRVAARYGPIERANTWVVGDTPFDAACAAAADVRCLLVATGHAPAESLDAAGADQVLDDLSDTDAVLELLGVD